MIVKSRARGGPGSLAKHLMLTDPGHNERVRIIGSKDIAALGIREALHELDDMGAGAASKRTLFHGVIRTRDHEVLTDEQRDRAIDKFAETHGLEYQAYVAVEHIKDGAAHYHLVFSRIDQQTMTAIPDSHNYRKNEEVARALEREFGHELTRGVHVREKAREARPVRTPSHAEMQQQKRMGMTVQEAKQLITDAWRRTRTGAEFAEAVEQEGFTLAGGDRRDFVLVDRSGEIHGLGRRVEGARAKDIRARMADVDPDELLDVAQAKAWQRQMRLAAEREKGKGGQEFISAAERIRTEEIQREREAKGRPWARLNHNDQEIATALWKLGKTGAQTHVIARPGAANRRSQADDQAHQEQDRKNQDVVSDRDAGETTSSKPPRPETMIERNQRLRAEARAAMTPEERQRQDEARNAARQLREEQARQRPGRSRTLDD